MFKSAAEACVGTSVAYFALRVITFTEHLGGAPLCLLSYFVTAVCLLG